MTAERVAPEPGLYYGMPNEQYHATPALSASGLKLLRSSPKHYFGNVLDESRPARGTVDAFVLGSLFHCALFEPAQLLTRYVVKPDGHDGRTTAGKAWAAQHAQHEIVDKSKMDAAIAMAGSVEALPDVAALMKVGHAETSAFWRDDATGELCKCRPDWFAPAGDGVILIDGKSCQDASPDGFARAIWNYGYHLQAAWYVDGFEQATGMKVHGFVFAAVESAWPHVAAAYMLGDDVLDRARAENRRLLNLYAECRRTGNWPGYAGAISLIQLPAWAQRQLMENT